MASVEAFNSEVEELLTRSDLKRILKCSERSVINYERSGLLKSIRIGGLVRFTSESVREFIQRQSARSAP